MNKYIITLTFLFVSLLAFSQEVSTTTTLSQNKEGDIIETTTLIAKMSDNVIKCYQDSTGWFVVVETKKDVEAIEQRRKLIATFKKK